MDLEVVGRHALLFDDDANAAFVNSEDALVEWNSLLIDRYDVRHLLSGPPPPRNRRRQAAPGPDASLQPELDRERFLDLPSDEQEQDVGKDAEPVVDGGYRAVGFSYGNPDGATEQKSSDVESVYHPTFPVPENLIQNLPPTEKVHQIMARTATFVRKHGGQSEIVLRVKQGDNPTFGFLMPDHHLHPYFRFLVDHQELQKPLEQEKKGDNRPDQTGGALSLLGSVYGTGEDEDGATEDSPKPKNSKSQETVDAIITTASHGPESAGNTTMKNEMLCDKDKKEKVHAIKQNPSINTVKNATKSGVRRDGDTLVSVGTATNKSQAPAVPSASKVELPVLEPPSELKRVIEKIVEFILRNGKEFEAVLAEQDRKFGRFPFLLPSNQYHPFYLQVLQKTQESKSSSKGFASEKHESVGHGREKKTSRREGDAAVSSGTAYSDIPNDYNKKEKFKMVLVGKSKKDEQEPPSKANQPQPEVVIDAEAAAAILKAATRGIKNPGLELFPKLSRGNTGDFLSDDGGQSSSFGSLNASQTQSSIRKRDAAGEPGISVPAAKAMAETAALAAASEADSSEASLTREQKLKAERLKRAKMFAAMIKSGVAPLKPEPHRGLSVETSGSGVSSSGNEAGNRAGKEREGSSVPGHVETLEKTQKSEKKALVDESNERRSKRSYRSRSKRDGEKEEEEESEDVEEEEDDDGKKHPRKKHRSHRSSRHGGDRHKHRKSHSSSKDRESRHRHKHDDEYSDDEDRRSRHRHKHNLSDDDDDERRSSRKRRKHRGSDDDEDEHRRRHSRHRHRHGGSSGDEGRRRSKSDKRGKHRSERELELEEGEIGAKSDQSKASESRGASREASLDLLKPPKQGNPPPQPSESTVVPDDLRAKIRAMLMATM